MPTDGGTTDLVLRPGLHEDLPVVADLFLASRQGAVPAMPPMVAAMGPHPSAATM